MKFDQLVVLLPCESLESFDLRRKDEDAEQLLSAWSALWHPMLLATAGAIPRWLPAASPPPDPAGCLVVLPDCCEHSVPEDWLPQAETAGACVLRHFWRRDDLLAAAFERLGVDPSTVDADLAADFLALGFCHLQVELLTRKLRYMSNLDEASLQTAALAAADEALRGDVAASRTHLQAAFDRLHEAREYSYPTEVRLLDLTLVAHSTLGESLRAELAGGLPRNVLVSGETFEQMAQCEPATLESLKQALADNKAALIGGEHFEIPLPLLSPEAIELHLRRGLSTYEKHLERRPTVFGRRRFGLTPALPQVLERCGFTAALHCTLDDGCFPTSHQSRIQWEGIDGTTIESVGCLPVDASRASSLLRLPETIGDVMNLDNSATVMFAHWPGRSSVWYDDLRRIGAYGAVIGTFLTITEYFEQTSLAGQRNHYQPDQYRSPYLSQDAAAGRRDPISRWVRYFQRRAVLETSQTLHAMAALCTTSARKSDEAAESKQRGMIYEDLAGAIDAALVQDEDAAANLDDRLKLQLEPPLVGFASSIIGVAASIERGLLVVNPCSFAQQACVHQSSLSPHPTSVDVPAMGFAWVGPGDDAVPPPVERKGWFGKRRPQEPPLLAYENVLRNEFFEIHFDPHTGAIRTISDYSSRDPRLAQQIALRLPQGGEPGAEANYSIMAADEIVVTSPGPELGEIVSRGRLMDRQGRRVAGFRQTTRAWRGSRVIELQIELEIERQPGVNPWDSYYAARFAWKDETASLVRSVNLAAMPTELTQFESPHFVDIYRDKRHTTLLCGGLPYHRRFGPRKLDTLLVTHGETARTFRLGIGIDLPHPMSAALGFIAPPLVLPDQPPPPPRSGWLFHLDCRNVVATRWERLPINDDGAKEDSRADCTTQTSRDDCTNETSRDDRTTENSRDDCTIKNSRELTAPGGAGFRVRLLETDGRGVRLGLRCFRAVASAHKRNPGDVPTIALVVEGDCVHVPLGPHQCVEVECRFV